MSKTDHSFTPAEYAEPMAAVHGREPATRPRPPCRVEGLTKLEIRPARADIVVGAGPG